jgi:CubicO group peptidase (beta-lactamase class C family)
MLAMTARDYARFGLLFLRGGRWQDRVVVPAEWVKESTRNHFEKGWPWYGYYWWRLPWKTESSDPRLRGCYFASGGGGQHIIILPALDTVIVRLGDEPKLTPSGQKFVPELLNRFLQCLP